MAMKTRKSKRRYWINAKGQKNDPSLVPPDLNACQACPNVLGHGPFTLGSAPDPIPCGKLPTCVIVENKPPKPDGKIGAMSLCVECLLLFKQYRSPTFGKIHYLDQEPKNGALHLQVTRL